VLVLLIIFMVITPMLTKSLPILVPEKQETDVPQDVPDQLLLKVFLDGHIEVNKTAIQDKDIVELLESRLRGKDQRVVFFEAEDDVAYGRAVVALDFIKAAHATIGMMTVATETEAPAPAVATPPGGAPLP
jgi:biopolymer transport protein ExbD